MMKTKTQFMFVVGVIGTAFLFLQSSGPVAAPDSNRGSKQSSESTDSNDVPEAENPFRASAQSYVDAYARRDAKAIGALFTKEAEFLDEFGEKTLGRDAIVELFQGVFENSPEAMIDEINIERVRYINENVALEEGLVATKVHAGAPRQISRYIALHVKEADGVWRINTLKDFAQEKNSRYEQLDQLAWMVGEWVSEDDSSIVHTTCDWSKDGNYLLRRFSVELSGERVMNGVQRIGWDPIRREIRSWVFDSEGGVIEGTWKRNGDQWMVVSSGFTSEGEAASGVAIYTIVNNDRVTWQHRRLTIGNETEEDVAPVVMVRRPPAVGKPN